MNLARWVSAWLTGPGLPKRSRRALGPDVPGHRLHHPQWRLRRSDRDVPRLRLDHGRLLVGGVHLRSQQIVLGAGARLLTRRHVQRMVVPAHRRALPDPLPLRRRLRIGVGGVAWVSSEIAWVLFVVFMILFVISLAGGALRGRGPPV